MGTPSPQRYRGGQALADERQPPRSPARVMQLVELIASEPAPPTLGALSARLGVPKTSLVHLLRALEQAGYVSRNGQHYALGAAAYRMAAAVSAVDDMAAALRQVLETIGRATRETVLVGRFGADGLSGVYLDRVESPQAVRFSPDLNEPRPSHCTALGKVLLAGSTPAQLAAWLKKAHLQRFTAHTITSRTALRAELEQVRKQGWARSVDEMVEGGGALAAPVRAADGSVPCAIVIAAPTHRIAVHERAWLDLLQRHAAALSPLVRGRAAIAA